MVCICGVESEEEYAKCAQRRGKRERESARELKKKKDNLQLRSAHVFTPEPNTTCRIKTFNTFSYPLVTSRNCKSATTTICVASSNPKTAIP